MTKKKRIRRERNQTLRDFTQIIEESIIDARDFLTNTTPFEISLELAQMGASTISETEMVKFLNQWTPPFPVFEGDEPIKPFEALAQHWEDEIEKKRGSGPELDDSILLTEIARYYCLKLEIRTTELNR